MIMKKRRGRTNPSSPTSSFLTCPHQALSTSEHCETGFVQLQNFSLCLFFRNLKVCTTTNSVHKVREVLSLLYVYVRFGRSLFY